MKTSILKADMFPICIQEVDNTYEMIIIVFHEILNL